MTSINSNTCWRAESGLKKSIFYKKRFAFFPKVCTDGSKIWLKSYFDKFEIWKYSHIQEENEFGHTDFIESITEEEYVIRKLAEML